MADILLATRGSHPPPTVSKNWPTAFIKRREELRSRYSRKYDYKRALNEDPKALRACKEIKKLKSLVAFLEQQVDSAEKFKQFEKAEVGNFRSFVISSELSLKMVAATSIMIPAETHKAEQVIELSRQGATCQNVEEKGKVHEKAQQEAARKVKDEKKARAKAQQEAAKTLQEVAKKLKDEKKARGMDQKRL
ncbi:hypothetical protein PEBR_00470 [Penicillium brasilianum]|uniref:Uncharacterized protein n=1 Tax=Penicillium brasilianum TaxID=104259 RepID=A0A1S9S0G7_PENBI|nr:hypothetical protein PEBR_00470 [Penicillium brasilianum]